jgi:hypothetical protein
MKLPIDESKISELDKQNPTVLLLLEVIRQQAETIEQLRDEINRLKNHPRKPDIKPSRLEKDKSQSQSKKDRGERPGSKKRKKTAEITIHEDIPVEPPYLPKGARFIAYKDFVVQGIKFQACNVGYRLKYYELPDGSHTCAKLPEHLNGKHFSPELISFILYQHYHCHVTQPLLLEQLHDIGIEISKGQINNILIENKQRFHEEKEQILSAGLDISSYVNVDDTGARHQGKNGYCTHIGNEAFSWFESTGSKSRINFLKLMQAGWQNYILNPDALNYMAANNFPAYLQKNIAGHLGTAFANDHQWNRFLADKGIVNKRQIFTARTHSATLNQALKRLFANKEELLLVLQRPDIPLHNNSAENALREYVKRRKISGSTRSARGRQARDTFVSLKKTCRKLGISFWQYLNDRITNSKLIPPLPDLIKAQARSPD